VSITTVICHTGIQYSFHVSVKPLFLSAPPITMCERGREREYSEGVGMTGERGRGRERERDFEIERALLQSSPWVGGKKSIVEHKVSLMQQG